MLLKMRKRGKGGLLGLQGEPGRGDRGGGRGDRGGGRMGRRVVR